MMLSGKVICTPSDLEARLNNAGPKVNPVVTQTIVKALMLFQFEVSRRTPKGISQNPGLKSSIQYKLITPLSGELGSVVKYLEPVEYGSKPHWPPRAPIELWVRRKLVSKINLKAASRKTIKGRRRKVSAIDAKEARIKSLAFLICRAISRRGTSRWAEMTLGTKGFLMFRRGFEAAMPRVEAMFQKIGGIIIERIAG